MRKIKKLFTLSILSASLFGGALPAYAQRANFTDVPTGHWATKAIRDLVEKYGVITGFPDQTFRGPRNVTRYEIAAALFQVMEQMAKVEDLTRRIGKVSLQDLKDMKALQEEFTEEIATLKKQSKEQAEKIEKLEKAINKIKDDLGSVRFGGRIEISAEDVMEDNFRPGYSTFYALNMRIAATEKTTIRSQLNGSFSSVQAANDKGDKNKKSQFTEEKDISVGFGEAWFDHKVDGFLNPRVKFGFMGVWRLITPFTSVSHNFGSSVVGIIDRSAVSKAAPNLFGASRGIRLTQSFIAGADFSEGIFSGAIAASPDVFYGQAKLDFGLVRLKLVSEGDQSLVIGEPVLDTLHNHTAMLDIGNDNIGLGLQATFRGLAQDLDFRGASANTHLGFNGFSVGASGKLESEETYQQVIGGLYLSTPSNLKQMNKEWPDQNIPSLLFAIQSPFTLQNNQLFEGSPDEVGDMAGFMVQLSYDNPIIPNLTLELGRRQKVFMNILPTDEQFNKTTFAVYSAFYF